MAAGGARMPAQCQQQAGWATWGTLLLVPATDARSSSGNTTGPAAPWQGCPVPSLRGSCRARLALAQVQSWLGTEAALGQSAQPLSVLVANVPRLSLGALWVSWPVPGGLSSAMGLTPSAMGWGTVYPLSSPNHFLLSLLVLFFFQRALLLSPLPPASGPSACAATGSPADPEPGHHPPCWADRGAAQPLPSIHRWPLAPGALLLPAGFRK